MGARGPVPKRSTQRRRRNKQDGPPPKAGKGSGRDQWVAYAESLGIEVPEGAPRADVQRLVAGGSADSGWHPLALQWFQSLQDSGQAQFYEPSDWATARILAESISRELSPQPMVVGKGPDAYVEMVTLPPKGASLAAWLKAMSSLLATEGDRRRLQLELQRTDPEDESEQASVTDIRSWREGLNG